MAGYYHPLETKRAVQQPGIQGVSFGRRNTHEQLQWLAAFKRYYRNSVDRRGRRNSNFSRIARLTIPLPPRGGPERWPRLNRAGRQAPASQGPERLPHRGPY